jgi:hypothetical protein
MPTSLGPHGKVRRCRQRRGAWGLIDHDAASDDVVSIEIWSASKCLPAEVLASLPSPASADGAAA